MSSPSKYFLKSQRIGFRIWKKEDIPLAIGLWGDVKVTQLIDARGNLSPAQVTERLLQEIDTEKRHGIQYWPIFLLESGCHVGCCGLRPYVQAKNVLEIGFHIRHRHWGQGYAFEAAQAVVRYAFNTITVSGLFAGHHPMNDVSRRLLEKLGFRFTHNEFYEPTGLNHPSYMLAADDYARLINMGDMQQPS